LGAGRAGVLLGMLWTALDDGAGEGVDEPEKDVCLLSATGEGCAPVPAAKGLALGLKAIEARKGQGR
jgi:hypothetical protein